MTVLLRPFDELERGILTRLDRKNSPIMAEEIWIVISYPYVQFEQSLDFLVSEGLVIKSSIRFRWHYSISDLGKALLLVN